MQIQGAFGKFRHRTFPQQEQQRFVYLFIFKAKIIWEFLKKRSRILRPTTPQCCTDISPLKSVQEDSKAFETQFILATSTGLITMNLKVRG